MFKRLARAVLPDLPHWRWCAEAAVTRTRADIRKFGVATLLRFAWDRHLTCASRGQIRSVRLPGCRLPLHYRVGTSDLEVIRQVFGRREYDFAAALSEVEFVVDCGANAGYSAFFLLHHYPEARVVVVEPDPGNMALCRKNLVPFGKQVTFVQAGVWSSSGPLVVDRGRYGDGREWSFQVRPAREGEPADVQAVTVPDLMAAGGFPRIDLLKMDIEAAEAEVFRNGANSWLDRVRNLVIELHGAECERAVSQALAGFKYRTSRSGELTLFRDLAPCV